MFKFLQDREQGELVLPQHIGIIMDGNGRWAKKRLQPRVFGHKAGMDALQEVTLTASELGIKVLTVYAFSTENWSRPADEVNFIMKLPIDFFDKYVPRLHEEGVKVQILGDRSALPEATNQALDRALELTAQNDGLILNFALNYGGRAEITDAVKAIAQAVQTGELAPEVITEETIADHLLTAGLAPELRDPDLIIRTSGEERLSNFLPWQSAYSEFYFTDVLWPDFKREELIKALEEFGRRNRRFGGV